MGRPDSSVCTTPTVCRCSLRARSLCGSHWRHRFSRVSIYTCSPWRVQVLGISVVSLSHLHLRISLFPPYFHHVNKVQSPKIDPDERERRLHCHDAHSCTMLL